MGIRRMTKIHPEKPVDSAQRQACGAGEQFLTGKKTQHRMTTP